MESIFLKLFLLLSLLVSWGAALNLPGVAPNSWDDNELVTLKANKVTSMKTPMAYNYYDLPFCKRRKTKAKSENLGESLSGDSLTASPYEVSVLFSLKASFPTINLCYFYSSY